MEEISVQKVIGAVNGRLLTGDPISTITGVSTDTRTIKPGELFFALKGENADGHAYVPKAIEAGAGVVISDESSLPGETNTIAIKVEDPLWALGDLAKYYRSLFKVRVVGITGSVGKTTTKEMLTAILKQKWKVLKNKANYNNEIGLPLTLFELDRSHEVAVLEMAMRGLGEIQRLASIAKPEIGVITNIGISHIERLGSQGAIADAKAELLGELPPDGVAILNAEDGYFEVIKEKFSGKVVSFGSSKSADVIGARVKCLDEGQYRFVLLISGQGALEVTLPIMGHHNVYNALAAAAAANQLGLDLPAIRAGLETVTPPDMRMEFTQTKGGLAVLNDAYNASPASVIAALKTLQALKGYDRKVAVLGDMLELGDYARKAHEDVGRALVESGVKKLIVVGKLAGSIADGAKAAGIPNDAVKSYETSAEAAKKIRSHLRAGDAVLVKGSRAVKMEAIVRALLDD
ncbi:MAG TPA: UDP-N-acetylmuramoyl-tripeptide--D-alanyl-D-alanine ligase [Armatimonadota bacterium]|nr:UDP-N-acetylmuramoyl-tripeptide--D-alanyl-D-alanine ligase [Armatimonadota bacterium]